MQGPTSADPLGEDSSSHQQLPQWDPEPAPTILEGHGQVQPLRILPAGSRTCPHYPRTYPQNPRSPWMPFAAMKYVKWVPGTASHPRSVRKPLVTRKSTIRSWDQACCSERMLIASATRKSISWCQNTHCSPRSMQIDPNTRKYASGC